MSSQPPRVSDFNDRGSLIFLVVAVAAYLPLLFDAGRPLALRRLLLLVCLGGIYLVLGIYGWGLIEEQRRPVHRFLYFTGQLLLVLLLLVLADANAGTLWLLLLPIAGQSVGLPRGATVAVSTAIVASLFLLTLSQGASWAVTLQTTAGIVAAVVFVVLFSAIALSEEQARHEVERLATELRQANTQLREYALQVEELATTTERNRLAREIHDSLGHYLTVINVQLGAAQAVLEGDPDTARDVLQKAQRLAQEGLADVRRSVAALRESPLGDRPLADALASLIAASNRAGIETLFSAEGEPRPLEAPAELTLYRAVQEGLTNARKHARAQRIAVTLAYTSDVVRLSVADDGVGAASHGGGFGLLGLRERVDLLGGEVSVETAPGEGFRLCVTVPG